MSKINVPKVIKVEPLDNLLIKVFFSNGSIKKFDCHILLNRDENFKRLQNAGFFKNIHIDNGGYGISWDDDLDISEYELWTSGY